MRPLLVSHPHAAAFASFTARAFAARQQLAQFVTGVASSKASVVRNRSVGVEPRLLRSLAPIELGARLAAHLIPGLSAYDAMFVAHDATVARLRWPKHVGAVYAYEDAALRTFRRAEQMNLPRIWDLPVPHWRTLAEMWEQEHRRWPTAGAVPHVEPEWKRLRKDDELRLANVVSVASSFTRSSLEANDARAPIVVTPYPFPVEQFPAKATRPSGPFTVLAVGTHGLRKGTPYLLDAWKRADLREARLILIGRLELSKAFLDGYAGTFEHIPHVARTELAPHYQAADVLAFPTLGDGFGLVMQEAMCSGTPVITTRCGGGPECIRNGEDGWIVDSSNVDALVDALRARAADREGTWRAGAAARAKAETWTEALAGAALVDGLGGATGS